MLVLILSATSATNQVPRLHPNHTVREGEGGGGRRRETECEVGERKPKRQWVQSRAALAATALWLP
jgi:hypothetical protein